MTHSPGGDAAYRQIDIYIFLCGGILKCVVINDKSQGSTAKHFSCERLLHYKFTIQFADERIFKIGEHLVKL